MKNYLVAALITVLILELVVFLILGLLGKKHLDPEKFAKIKKKFRLQGYLGLFIGLMFMFLLRR